MKNKKEQKAKGRNEANRKEIYIQNEFMSRFS